MLGRWGSSRLLAYRAPGAAGHSEASARVAPDDITVPRKKAGNLRLPARFGKRIRIDAECLQSFRHALGVLPFLIGTFALLIGPPAFLVGTRVPSELK
jgi:hypothetical protein